MEKASQRIKPYKVKNEVRRPTMLRMKGTSNHRNLSGQTGKDLHKVGWDSNNPSDVST
jgi:hypothetical protein